LTPFSTLKDELLSILRERYPNGLPTPTAIPPPNFSSTSSTNSAKYIPIPSSILDVVLGIPTDENDPTKGWEELKLSVGGWGMKDSPKSLGLRDGSLIAFRFRNEEEDEDGNEVDGAEEDRFEVAWSSYDENYGEPDPRQRVDEMDEDEDEGRHEERED
jgi:hypothetical protein